jgi:hypothetical protein
VKGLVKQNFIDIFANVTNTVTEHKPLQVGRISEKIDLNAMARKYKSGLYYLMCIVDQKIESIRDKKLLNDQKKRGATHKQFSRYKARLVKKREDQQIFQKIEQFNQAMEDSENMMLILSQRIDTSKGQKPSARAYCGCIFSGQKFYFYGGKNNDIMNDLRSLNLDKMEWTHED